MQSDKLWDAFFVFSSVGFQTIVHIVTVLVRLQTKCWAHSSCPIVSFSTSWDTVLCPTIYSNTLWHMPFVLITKFILSLGQLASSWEYEERANQVCFQVLFWGPELSKKSFICIMPKTSFWQFVYREYSKYTNRWTQCI